MLKLRLFGSPQILWHDSPFKVDRSTTRALLFALSTHLQPISRQRLNLLFYPEAAQSTARRKVTKLISALRSALPDPNLLLSTEEQVWLQTEDVQSDTVQFAALSSYQAIEPLSAAVDLYNEPFLQGFRVPKCPEFDGWVEEERRSFDILKGNCLETLIYLHNEQGHHQANNQAESVPALIHCAEQLVALDPRKESAQYQLIYQLFESGQRDDALHQYQCYRDYLLKNDEDEPGPSVRTLFEQIINGLEPSPPAAIIPPIADRPSDVGPFEPGHANRRRLAMRNVRHNQPLRRQKSKSPAQGSPLRQVRSDESSALFVGRVDELELLYELYANATQGRGRVALISGETGIGKTALVEKAIERNALPPIIADRTLILRGAAYPGSHSLPYSLLLEAFRSTLINPKITKQLFTQLSPLTQYDLVSLLPEMHGFMQTSGVQLNRRTKPTQTDQFEALSQLLFALAAGNQCVVLQLENLQWADRQSLEWLSYAGRKIATQAILIIGTLSNHRQRSALPWHGSVSNAATDLDKMRYTLMQRKCLTAIDLEGFTEAEARELLNYNANAQRQFDAIPTNFLVSELHEICGGNPALLQTTLDSLQAIHKSESQSGIWEMVAQEPAFQERVQSILLTLSQESRGLLLTAAVLGPSVHLFELQQISELPGKDISASLGELIDHSLVIVEFEELKFRHEILRIALTKYIHPAQKSLLAFQRRNRQLL